MKTALLEIGAWLRDEEMPVENVASKAFGRMASEDQVTRQIWSGVSVKIQEADWPQFAAMSGMMWQELVAGERYEVFRELLHKNITAYWMGWIKQRLLDQGEGRLT